MAATKQDIIRWLDRAKSENCSHLIVVCDTFDHDDYPVYVAKGEDVNRRMRFGVPLLPQGRCGQKGRPTADHPSNIGMAVGPRCRFDCRVVWPGFWQEGRKVVTAKEIYEISKSWQHLDTEAGGLVFSDWLLEQGEVDWANTVGWVLVYLRKYPTKHGWRYGASLNGWLRSVANSHSNDHCTAPRWGWKEWAVKNNLEIIPS